MVLTLRFGLVEAWVGVDLGAGELRALAFVLLATPPALGTDTMARVGDVGLWCQRGDAAVVCVAGGSHSRLGGLFRRAHGMVVVELFQGL